MHVASQSAAAAGKQCGKLPGEENILLPRQQLKHAEYDFLFHNLTFYTLFSEAICSEENSKHIFIILKHVEKIQIIRIFLLHIPVSA